MGWDRLEGSTVLGVRGLKRANGKGTIEMVMWGTESRSAFEFPRSALQIQRISSFVNRRGVTGLVVTVLAGWLRCFTFRCPF